MTTANLLNVSSVKGPQVDVSKRLQEENREVTEIFASMMNQTVDTANQMVDDTSSEIGVSKADGTQSITDSYERYSYKDNQIEEAKQTQLTEEELHEVEESLEQTEDEILNTLSEEYGVDEETLHNLLDEMGLSVLDLLDPKNLVSFIMALTGIASGEELLLDENFLKVMETMDALADALKNELHVDAEGLQEIISSIETMNLENEGTSFQEKLEATMENLHTQDVTDSNTQDATSVEELQTTQMEENDQQNVSNALDASKEATEGMKVQVEEQGTQSTGDAENKTTEIEVEEVSVSTETDADSSLFDNQNMGKDSLLNQDTSSNQVFVTTQSTSTLGQVSQMPQAQLSSYFSVDTAQIMEQLAEQIKVVVTPDTTSMEMQLNPENLGKIYLHVSTEEGVVNAQFMATNEAVKEALETQIVTLKENLTQAGVKVDAIEVTIASHEFERNLEQNQKNSQDEQIQEDVAPKRRNITVNTLDELAGVMTEEETLVAQIMRDNGNSVDFTA